MQERMWHQNMADLAQRRVDRCPQTGHHRRKTATRSTYAVVRIDEGPMLLSTGTNEVPRDTDFEHFPGRLRAGLER
jgi:hypothetical protein